MSSSSSSENDPSRSPALDLGPIRQNGYVVTDMEAALHHWTTVLGVGPFYLIETVALDWFRCRSSEEPPVMSIALANSGPLQIELICQHDETPSMFREFLADGPEGLQHIAYWSTRFQADHDRLVGAGYEPTQEGQIGGPDGRFAYFASAGPRGTVLELSDVSGAKGKFFEHIREASEGWDGSRPVRTVS
jgi:glyoxalase/bleomycin resistance protein/dioxygenase superfamily protein